MHARADEACEAGNRRNSYRERRITAIVGAISPRIPKLRARGRGASSNLMRNAAGNAPTR